MSAAIKFLTTLFERSSGPVFVTSLANDRAETGRIPPAQIVTREVVAIERFAAKWDRPERALYFCVATLQPGVLRRAKASLHELVCLHADLDVATIDASRGEIERAIAKLPASLAPSLVVFSGHGLHLYWPLVEVLPATLENIGRIEAALKLVADMLAGDPAVCECSRLMRLPGSHNSKHNEWTAVCVVQQTKRRYRLETLERALAKATPVLRRRPKETRIRQGNPWIAYAAEHAIAAPIDVDERVAEMTYHGPGETSIHLTQLSVTAALLKRGYPLEDVVARVLRATAEAAGPVGRGWNWRKEESDIRTMCLSWLRKHPQFVLEI